MTLTIKEVKQLINAVNTIEELENHEPVSYTHL